MRFNPRIILEQMQTTHHIKKYQSNSSSVIIVFVCFWVFKLSWSFPYCTCTNVPFWDLVLWNVDDIVMSALPLLVMVRLWPWTWTLCCVVFLCKILHFHSASPHPGV